MGVGHWYNSSGFESSGCNLSFHCDNDAMDVESQMIVVVTANPLVLTQY